VCRVASVCVRNGAVGAVDDELAFQVTLDVASALKEDVVVRCVYVVDASRPELDLELDALDVGNGPGLPQGVMKFDVEAPAPARSVLERGGGPLEVGGIYLSALYRGAEFCRVGYYVRHEYDDPAMQEAPPEIVDWGKLRRVLSEPCLTRFAIAWDDSSASAGAGLGASVEGESCGLGAPTAVVFGASGADGDVVGGGEGLALADAVAAAMSVLGDVGPDDEDDEGDDDLDERGPRDRSRSPPRVG